MSYEVVFTATARRDLHSVPPRILPAVIEFAYGDLCVSPRRVGKPLSRDLEGAFGARRGPYRVLHEIGDDAQQIRILRVDHRSDVYRPR